MPLHSQRLGDIYAVIHSQVEAEGRRRPLFEVTAAAAAQLQHAHLPRRGKGKELSAEKVAPSK